MNADLDKLLPYPFERLAALKASVAPPDGLGHIALSIGEPKHAPPAFVLDELRRSMAGFGSYPTTAGSPELRAACGRWLERRFGFAAGSIAERQVLPVNGTREALFAVAQAVVDRGAARGGAPLVAMPNPFYQIYEGAALLAGAEPLFIDTRAADGFLPDLDAVPPAAWDRCQLLYLCNPGNPAGAVMDVALLRRILELAERHDFVVAADECYADIYPDESAPPPSLLSAALAMGDAAFRRCLVFHSLSKRSSLPGLRSGFVAGDARLLERFLLYRTYHGCSMPLPVQLASIAAWGDDAHARANRALYREKFARVVPVLAPHLDVQAPAGGFYLWPDTGRDDEAFVRDLYARKNVTVVPGSYLARDAGAGNPGAGRVRISLVAEVDECVEAAHRIADFMQGR
ncbi:MAG: succinyldiaminopimelate transaminase [Gammaproteobacteria bacterium]|nr:succinyldiaminopimelate transaminase [Gammaproteobacteria bacterium]